MVKEISDVVNFAYERFLMRDLTYIFGGALLLVSIKYAYDGYVVDFIDYFSQDIIKLLFFIAVTYFLGLITQEGLSFIRVVKTKLPFQEEGTSDYIRKISIIEKHYGEATTRRLERIIYLKHIGAAVGASAFASLLILIIFAVLRFFNIGFSESNYQISIEYYLICLAMFVLLIVCIKENRWKLSQQDETIEDLIKNIN